jgi:Protein of unknown function (DUF3618)
MGEGQGQERAQLVDDQDKSAAQLRAEIEGVREDLGDTAAALAAKTDVKTRARERADEVKRNARAKKDELLSKAKGSSAGEAGSHAGPGGSQAAGGAQAGGMSERATSAMTQLQAKARANPVPTAALGALIGGFLLGRLGGRD